MPERRHGVGGRTTLIRILEGNHAVSEAVRLARVQVISAYPITPQTHIVETLSEYCADGKMNARFLCVESEHSAMGAAIAAAMGGARTFTATSSHGLAYMHELLHWSTGARLPIVMAEVNRAMGPGWNIWTDQTDSLSQRDTGWIQLYCEDGQEVLDTTVSAFRLAETVNLPVMIVLDAFYLSHTFEPVDVPEQGSVDRFLPPFSPRFAMDTENPANFGELVPPGLYMEMRRNIQLAMESVPGCFSAIEEEFFFQFGRRYGPVECWMCDDAEVIMVVSGTITGTCRQVVGDLRGRGEKAGLMKIKMFRPFPAREIRNAFNPNQKLAVVDRNFSFGAGGIFAQELKAVLYQAPDRPRVFEYIAGLGGRDVTPKTLETIYRMTKEQDTPKMESVWIDLNVVDEGI
ncbi:MAG: pyruvate ferredoxin oxidoreductase [Deltaproteobacteria bacterium RBG_13_49_15]|nr:MAG: pyruvate ferredoxin oxidoreductase [Deltaproteobacteria bacterium RBG_13_49_15]